MSQRDARINDLLALDRLATCPKCFTYSTGDETHCLDCGCRLYPTERRGGNRAKEEQWTNS